MTWKMDPAAYEAFLKWPRTGTTDRAPARKATKSDRGGSSGQPGKLARLQRTFGRRCHYCEAELSKAEMTRDHVIPVSRNGTNALANLAIACENCNSEKADRTPTEWRGSPCCLFHRMWETMAV